MCCLDWKKISVTHVKWGQTRETRICILKMIKNHFENDSQYKAIWVNE